MVSIMAIIMYDTSHLVPQVFPDSSFCLHIEKLDLGTRLCSMVYLSVSQLLHLEEKCLQLQGMNYCYVLLVHQTEYSVPQKLFLYMCATSLSPILSLTFFVK